MDKKRLFSLEMKRQKLDIEIQKLRTEWLTIGSRIRSLGQEKGDVARQIFDHISKG